MRALLTALLVTTPGTSCSLSDGEAVATWEVAPRQALDADTTTFIAVVTRLGCNSGVTGTIDDPDTPAGATSACDPDDTRFAP